MGKGPDFGPEEASNSTNLFFPRVSEIIFVFHAIHCISTMLILPQPLDSGSTKKKHSPFLRGGAFDRGERGNPGNPRVTAICVVESWQKRVKWPLSLVFMPTLRFLDWKTLASEKGSYTVDICFLRRLETASKQTCFYPNFLLDLHLKSCHPSWYHLGVGGAPAK